MQSSQISVSPIGKIFLTLPGKSYKAHRCLGQIIGNEFHCERNPERHLFQQFGGSYGFNFELMRDGTFKFVIVQLPFGGQLITTRLHILENGRFLNFKRNQLERQIFLPVIEFGLEKAQKSERPIVKHIPAILQPSLFEGVL
jgi:hypothetical protein